MSKEKKKSVKPSRGLFNRLFGDRNAETDFMQEEQLQSPGRLIVKNFLHNKFGMTGLCIFLLIFLFVMIGPRFLVLDLSYADNTQTNVPPTMSMMKPPAELVGNIADITPGTTYGVGVSKDGKVYIWGHTQLTEVINLADIPEEVRNAKIVNIAAGNDHVAALDENGGIYVWGSDRLGQGMLPLDISNAMKRGKNLGFKQLEAGNQFTAALTEDGQLYLCG